MNEESKIGVYIANLTAEETDAEVVTVEPDRYRSADGVEWVDAEPTPSTKPKDKQK